MSDEVTKLTSGNPAVPTTKQAPPRRERFFARRKAQRSSLTHCENCGTELRGHYCPHCGQPAIDYRRSFRHVLVDLLDQFLNWDSKFFKTIALILIQPWKLTNDFLAGHRVRYVHPLRLYLLASILFFFAVSYWAKAIHVTPNRFSLEERAAVEAELKKRDMPPEVRAKVENALKRASSPGSEQAEQSSQAGPTPKEVATPLAGVTSSENLSTPFEGWIEKRAKEKIGEHGTNMQLFIRTLISNLPYMMLCCIPLFAFVLKVLYVRRHIFYIDHLIYALHIHTFAYTGIMLIVLATVGLNRVASGPTASRIIAFLWIAFVVQIFLSVRRVYRQGWFISVFKFLFGGLAYLIVLAVALAATFFVTLALPG
jgi:ribosomal protein L32